MADSKMKLTYFNVKGLAESIRFIFAYADVDYEDVRIEKADWPAVKESYPFHKLPVLEVDGKVLNQSVAIARYVGKRFGLQTDDPLREALLEALVDNLRDLQGKFRDVLHLKTPEAKKDCDEALDFFLNRIEPVASEGYFYGSNPTWVDIFFTGFYDTVESFIGDFLKPFPNLTSLVEKVKSKDSIKAYLEKRPETQPPGEN